MARTRVAFEDVPPAAAPTRRASTAREERLAKPSRRDRKRSEVRVAPVANPGERRYYQTVRRIDVWSVLKVSVCFYLSSLVVTVTSGILVWYAARTMGVIDNFESLIKSLFGFKEFTLLSWQILRAGTLIGLVLTCLAIVMTTLAAALYNLFAGIVGGVEITVAEDDTTAR